jgi:hypothetical protein
MPDMAFDMAFYTVGDNECFNFLGCGKNEKICSPHVRNLLNYENGLQRNPRELEKRKLKNSYVTTATFPARSCS